MPQIIKARSRATQLGQGLGDALNRGMKTGLDQLISTKLKQLTDRQREEKTETGLNSLLQNPEEAQALSGLDPKLLGEALKLKQREKGFESLSSLMGFAPQQQQQPIEGQEESLVDQQQLQQPSGGINPGLSTKELMDFAGFQQREKFQQQKIGQKEKEFAFNFTKNFTERVNKNARDAKGTLQNLKTQRDLVNRGKLIGPRQNVLLDFVGNALGLDEEGKTAFKNADSIVFEKLSVPFFKDLKEKFGARPTQWDAQQLKKSFPTLYQSDVGKKIIIDFMEHDSNSQLQEKRITNQIINENGGVPPLDLESQVTDRLEKWKDKSYLKLRNKASEVLAEQYSPSISAEKAGKGQKGIASDGTILISTGKKWKVLFSDDME